MITWFALLATITQLRSLTNFSCLTILSRPNIELLQTVLNMLFGVLPGHPATIAALKVFRSKRETTGPKMIERMAGNNPDLAWRLPNLIVRSINRKFLKELRDFIKETFPEHAPKSIEQHVGSLEFRLEVVGLSSRKSIHGFPSTASQRQDIKNPRRLPRKWRFKEVRSNGIGVSLYVGGSRVFWSRRVTLCVVLVAAGVTLIRAVLQWRPNTSVDAKHCRAAKGRADGWTVLPRPVLANCTATSFEAFERLRDERCASAPRRKRGSHIEPSAPKVCFGLPVHLPLARRFGEGVSRHRQRKIIWSCKTWMLCSVWRYPRARHHREHRGE